MALTVVQEKLTSDEKLKVMEATKLFENLVYVGWNTWDHFDWIYKIYINNNFAGVCAVNTFQSYAKMGPLVLLPTFHGKGLGKKLVTTIVEREKQKHNLYIGNSNLKVWHIADGLDFVERSTSSIPYQVKIIYVKMSLIVLREGEFIPFLKELMRKLKRFPHREKLKHFCLNR